MATSSVALRLAPLFALIVGGAAYASGCVGDLGGDPNGSGDKPKLDPDSEPGVAPLMKLSTLHYQNTVADLLKMNDLDSLVPVVEPFVSSIPKDSSETFRGLDNRVAGEHMQGYYNVATAIGDAVEEDAGLLAALAGECATDASLSASCAQDFVERFGMQVFRRPLTEEEAGRYLALNDGVRPPAEAVRAMVVTLLLSPQFLNHLELDGVAFEGRDDVLQLTAYELASKLSYTFWQSMPDQDLFDAAADGSLLDEEGYQKALDRVYDDPRTQETVWQFWNQWLRLERFTGFSSTRPAFQTLAEGENVGEPGHDHYADMVEELRALTELYTWDQSGTLVELLTTDVSVTTSDDLAHLYGVEAYSGSGDYPRFDDGERAGILQRAALLVSSLEQTNPFHRGAFVRRYILCDPLPAPDPNKLPPGSLDPPPFVPDATTRERFEQKVAGNDLCMGCHGSFSDIGYVMESFDALGRYRETELVLDEQTGEVVAELPIDNTAVAKVEYDDTGPVKGPSDLNQRIVDSGKVAHCLSSQYFSYALRREIGDEGGDAAVADALAGDDLALSEVFKLLAQHPSFKIRKVGAQ